MTWRQWQAARQLLAEEFFGAPRRASQAAEDAQFRQSAEALRRPR
jgi:hypothetical protein